MAKILDGRIVQAEIKKTLMAARRRLLFEPQLVIIQVGARPESNLYIERKQKFGEEIGVKVTRARYAEKITETKLISAIKNFNADPTVQGIIVQLPLPRHLPPAPILNAVDLAKDVDGLAAGSNFQSATARAVLTLLDYYNFPLAGRKVTVVGRSTLVGKPIALACLKVGATVTIGHQQTKNLSMITKRADILIVATGAAGLITKNYVRPEQVVIDVGINVVDNQKQKRKIIGDVTFAEVAKIVRAISPVPGGVGPLTIACLFENLLSTCTKNPAD
ncbi:MAG: bifunctional 5,10-methylenetetrahydrofolate dehydrogenase/5,10-methenyltetrahydrofolate cyclohydrolase [Patescibacteria group bacterium]